MKRFHLILLMFIMILGGCSSRITPPDSVQMGWQKRLAAQTDWRVQGKVAFLSSQERQSANFVWNYKEPFHDIKLTSFIGTQVLHLVESRGGVSLELPDDTFYGKNTAELLARLTGLQLPVADAEHWLTATLTLHDARFDEQARLVSGTWLDQQGQVWQLNYQQYINQDGFFLPTRITLKNQDLTIKLNLSRWQFT
ncbi:lipoprotein insertase outer membrane protein LolB [Pseudoalteromonas fenneropenaei]|uniref:Outer-membrane lipoprotein LolB n=1 Tax=Pseudoalteromonas fenneropenaei TaxID=1737459 RepID=A0ABV7CGV5_9GAMM